MRNVWKRNRVLAACLATLAFACGASGCVTQEGERPAPAPAVRTPAIDRPDETRLPESVRRWRRANGERPGTFERIEGGALYLLVNLGEKPTGGYGVRVEEAFL
ncbi:MAG TPA: protease complex subunit PrcB family protein, partial [Planctomycetaceae bacterium]